MDVDYSFCEYYDFDVWLPVSGYNKNNHKKKPPVFPELNLAHNKCRSDALASYPSFDLALDALVGSSDGIITFVSSWPSKSITRREDWNFCCDWDFDSSCGCVGSCVGMG